MQTGSSYYFCTSVLSVGRACVISYSELLKSAGRHVQRSPRQTHFRQLEDMKRESNRLPNVPVYSLSLCICVSAFACTCARMWRCLCLFRHLFLMRGNEWHLFRVLNWSSFLKCNKSCVSSPAATVQGISEFSLPNAHFVCFVLQLKLKEHCRSSL